MICQKCRKSICDFEIKSSDNYDYMCDPCESQNIEIQKIKELNGMLNIVPSETFFETLKQQIDALDTLYTLTWSDKCLFFLLYMKHRLLYTPIRVFNVICLSFLVISLPTTYLNYLEVENNQPQTLPYYWQMPAEK